MAAGPAPLVVDSPSPAAQVHAQERSGYAVPLAILTSLFFIWGFITCLNDIIIPHLKAIFDLSYAQAMMIQFAFFTAYFIVSVPAGRIVGRLGYKPGIIVGLCTSAVGCLMFVPAADQRSYALMLCALLVLASGITLLQVAANPFVAALGSPQTASSRLTLTQAFNSLGTTLAPLFGAAVILSTTARSPDQLAQLSVAEREAYRVAEAASVQRPYLALAAVLFITAIAMALAKLPRLDAATGAAEGSSTAVRSEGCRSAWSHPQLVWGALAIFTYVGAEVAIGSFLINFMSQKDIAGLSEAEAARYVSFYWGAAMVGRFVGIFTLRSFRPRAVLGVHALVAAALVLATLLLSGPIAMWALLAVGFFNSVMFPAIFTLALEGLGARTGQGSGILCTAIVGGAVVPVVQGALADRFGLQPAFIVPVVCYAYVAWYAARGSARRDEAAVTATARA